MVLRSWLRGGVAVYAVVALALLLTGGPERLPGGSFVNLRPTKTIVDALTVGNAAAKFYLILNLILLVPAGVLMAVQGIRPRVAVAGIVGIAVAIEVAQFLVPGARSSDVDDVLLNAAGAVLAFLATRSVMRRYATTRGA